MIIRDSTASDYAAIAAVHNTVFKNRAVTAETLTDTDRSRKPDLKHRRWVALEDGKIVGVASYSQRVFDYHPQKFSIVVEVLPDYRQRGIGAALYDQIIIALKPYDPIKLRADGYGNLLEGVRFLKRRGFEEVFREQPLYLDVINFDPRPYAGLREELLTQGVEIKTLRELEGDPERDRKVYALYWEATGDVPKEGEITPMDFQEWVDWTINDPLVPHDAYVVAVHGDEYIGLSEFGTFRESDALQAGLVGVKREYRRQGIALAMQLRGIAYAQANGQSIIRTSTAVHNRPMLSLYERLGFARQPEWIQLEKNAAKNR
jgi:mycothiol synthase